MQNTPWRRPSAFSLCELPVDGWRGGQVFDSPLMRVKRVRSVPVASKQSTWTYYGLYGEVRPITEYGGGEISCEGGLGTGNALPGEQGAARVQQPFAAIASEHQQRKNRIGNKTQTLKASSRRQRSSCMEFGASVAEPIRLQRQDVYHIKSRRV